MRGVASRPHGVSWSTMAMAVIAAVLTGMIVVAWRARVQYRSKGNVLNAHGL